MRRGLRDWLRGLVAWVCRSRRYRRAPTWREEVLSRCGTDLELLVERCRHARQALDKPTGRWTRHTLHAAPELALTRGWPSPLIHSALLTVAADPDTSSPMRLAEAGPWWDTDRHHYDTLKAQ